MNPKVAVISLSYNHEPYLLDAINSIIAQTYRPLHWIICIDKSPDNSRQLLLDNMPRLEAAGVQVTFIDHEVNKGMFLSFDDCVEKLTDEEFIAHLETDDQFLPEKIERSIKFLQDNPQFGAVHTEINSLWTDGRFETHSWAKMGINLSDETTLESLLADNKIYTCTKVVRRKVFDELPRHKEYLDKGFRMGDYGACLNICLNGHRIGYIKEPLSIYRIVPNSASHRQDTYAAFVQSYLEIKEYYNKIYRERRKK